jgi:triphosphoribosyl-dephospho-CoA synthase
MTSDPIFIDIAAAAQLACLLEASAPKPGNVSPGRHFRDVRYEHFLASAAAIGPAFDGVAERPLGATIRAAIDATSRWTASNTNLGIVLLLAPLARAAFDVRAAGPTAAVLREAVGRVLDASTVDDARDVYAAIRQAHPGGLGHVGAQDVAAEPTVTLLEAMRLAAERDGIAHEYATGFAVTFDTAVPALERARAEGLAWDDAVVETFLTVLAARPDTHIARRGGAELAGAVSARARRVLAAGGVRTSEGREAIDGMDAALRGGDNTASPGTTADLTTAAVFVVLAAGGWDRTEGGRNATR